MPEVGVGLVNNKSTTLQEVVVALVNDNQQQLPNVIVALVNNKSAAVASGSGCSSE